MSPSHANKRGVRYRYYVSQAVLQNRKDEAGNIARVIAATRHHVGDIGRQVATGQTSPPPELSDRDLVALQVERIVLRSRYIDITLRGRTRYRKARSFIAAINSRRAFIQEWRSLCNGPLSSERFIEALQNHAVFSICCRVSSSLTE